MKRQIVAFLTAALLGLVARPGMAQQELPPGRAPVPPRPVEQLCPAPLPVTAPEAAPVAPPGCGVRVLWLNHLEPVQRLVPRQVVTEERRPTLEVAYRDETRVITEVVVKSREVERQVPCTVMKPVKETCPETGQCTTVWTPCTELKTVKEVEYYAAPEERKILVSVPYLKPAEIVVPRKTVVLEYLTTMQKRQEAVVIPGPEGVPTPYVLAPQACPESCPASHP
jgi:hypothetical protein